MADPPNKNKPDMSMEQRLLLAFVLMGLVLLVSQYFYKPTAPQRRSEVKQVEAPKPQEQATKPEETAEALTATAAPAPQVAAQAEEMPRVDTDVFSIVLSNRGAQVRSWVLKKYKTGAGKPVEVVNQQAAAKAGYPLAVVFADFKPPVDVNQQLYAVTRSPGGLGLDFDWSDGKLRVHKRLRFTRGSYLAQITSEVLNGGVAVPHLLVWRGGFGDPTAYNAAANQYTLYYDPAAAKLVTQQAKAAKNGPVSAAGSFTFAGLQDSYFAAVFMPRDGRAFEIQTLSDSVAGPSSAEEQPHVGAAVGGKGRNDFALFVGPKDLDLLRKVDAKLEQLVDFGTWFGFIAKPLFLVLNWVNDNWTHNYGWAIIVVTIAINFLLMPLKITSLRSMKKMSALQPQIAAINEKYKNISLRDPRKAEQNTEIMALYKKHGVNPAGGCMPILLQIPFFIAFYTVLTVAIEMRGASWLWVTDLSHPETIPIRILPLLMIATQFWLQKMTPATTADPTQQKMMMFMPLIFGFMFYGVSSGLVLYWLTGNLVSIAQQWFFNRLMPPAPRAVVDVKPMKKGGKK
ncbi:MAG TPA: membrane protein insertase YidC [Bryobacteraceae bacterium]|nr:membrane protein insertase YidC [Bryobacteraceae bacterium]